MLPQYEQYISEQYTYLKEQEKRGECFGGLVVLTSRCDREDPGSIPGRGIDRFFLFFQMAEENVFERALKCVLCTRKDMDDGEKIFVLNCCRRGVHKACLDDKYPQWRRGVMVCPQCRRRTCVNMQVIQRDTFSPEDNDKIEAAFLKHHGVIKVRMTTEERTGLRVALNVHGYRAMRHVSHRIFIVALQFWWALPKHQMCDWEDVVARLSLGLTWDKLSELRAQFRTRVEKDGRGDAFHHFVDYLLEAGEVDDEVAQRDCVLKTCEEQSCEECKTFISVFNGQRFSDHVALANRRYLYDRVEKKMYHQFVEMGKKKQTL